jgi:hypothetical protein
LGTILVAEIRGTRIKTCIGATLSATNSTWTGLEFDPGLHIEMVKSNLISHSMADTAHRLQMDKISVIFQFSDSLEYSKQLIILILTSFSKGFTETHMKYYTKC